MWTILGRKTVFGAPRNGDRGQGDEISGRLESRSVGGGRIDPDPGALSKQIGDQPVQRLIGTVPDIIVVAREEGDSQIARLHGQAPYPAKAQRQICVDPPIVKHGLPPVAAENARLFILGSLPGDASLAARQYYAHPRNQFWRLLGQAIGEDLQPLDYLGRLERIMGRGIGLWDVVAKAERLGSLDQSIRQAGHNPLTDYFRNFPRLTAIAFNGSTAVAIGRKLLGGTNFTLIDLPSSSPANTRPFEAKALAWRVLADFV